MRINVLSISPLLTSDKVSSFFPSGVSRVADHLRDTRFLGPNQQIANAYGNTVEWDITKQGAFFQKLYLRNVHSPQPVVSGTYVRVTDFAALAEIKEVNVRYTSNLIMRYSKWYMFIRYRKWLNDEKRSLMNPAVGGELTDAQRSIITQNGFETLADLLYLLSFDSTQSTPIFALSQKLTIGITFEQGPAVLQTDGLISDYMNYRCQPQLIVDFYHVTEKEQRAIIGLTMQRFGIPYIISNKEYLQLAHDVTKVAGDMTPFSIKLVGRGAVKGMYFMLIPELLVNQAINNDWFMIANNPVPLPANMSPYGGLDRFEVTSLGMKLVNPDAGLINFNKTNYTMMYHSASYGDNIFFWSFSIDPEAENAALGYLGMGNTNDAQLHLYFDTTTGTGPDPNNPANPQRLLCVIVMLGYTYVQFQGGDVTEVFL